MSETYFSESAFKDKLLTLILKDRNFLRLCSPVLDKKDFKVNGNSSRADKIKSELALMGLDFYEKFRDPIGDLAKTEVRSYARKNKLGEKWKDEALDIVGERLRKKLKAPDYITEKVIEFKKEQAKKSAISELITAQESGELSDDKWKEITEEALLPEISEKFKPIDLLAGLKNRILRRKYKQENRFPLIFIEDLDRRIRLIARGHLGLVLAPYKRGKSLFLLHIALALCLQKYNVLFFTLEDPLEDTEDRFDAAISFLPIKKLSRMPKTLKKRFAKFSRLIKSKLKIVDGTEGGTSIAKIESILDRERNEGFPVDAVIIDYDEEIQAKHKNKDRRMEFDEIYRDLRRLAAKKQVIVWTASQSKRGTHDKNIVTGDDVAEDVSKIKKAGIVLSLGQGDWGDKSIYIHVAAHKYDRQHIGVNIISDLDRMRIYDADATYKAKQNNPELKRRKQ